jgi:hypothetical protein
LVVYHGTVVEGRSTGIPFTMFDRSRLGSVNEASDAKEGFWFTSSQMRARIAASDAKAAVDSDGFSATVVPLYLRLENPKEGGAIGHMTSEQSAALLRQAKQDGHDGVIFSTGERGGKDYVVFESEQIKSAIGNRESSRS